VTYHITEVRALSPQLTDAHRAELDAVLSEHDAMIIQLRSQK
jgi:hypothetical protein